MPPKTKTTAAKADSAKPAEPLDQPAVDGLDTTAQFTNEPAVQGDEPADSSVGTLSAPLPDEPGPAETGDAGPEDTDAPEADERGFAYVPCQVCFPDGWPVEEEGAYVNCAHDFGIRYGESVEISRERAIELGFLDGEFKD